MLHLFLLLIIILKTNMIYVGGNKCIIINGGLDYFTALTPFQTGWLLIKQQKFVLRTLIFHFKFFLERKFCKTNMF